MVGPRLGGAVCYEARSLTLFTLGFVVLVLGNHRLGTIHLPVQGESFAHHVVHCTQCSDCRNNHKQGRSGSLCRVQPTRLGGGTVPFTPDSLKLQKAKCVVARAACSFKCSTVTVRHDALPQHPAQSVA
jgi:hypothetical protein